MVTEPGFGTLSKASEHFQANEQLALGSLVQWHNTAGLRPIPGDAPRVHVLLLSPKGQSLYIVSHQKFEVGSAVFLHGKCGSATTFRVDVEGVMDGVQSGVVESHL